MHFSGHKIRLILLLAFTALAARAAETIPAPGNLAELRQAFSAPPDDSRIMMRWWWFGPSVEKDELEREMRAMKSGGIGGFEVAVVNPIALDDPAKGIRNTPYLSADFLERLRFTGAKARELGLRMDLTIASGWPFANPEISLSHAARKLRIALLCVPADPFGRAPVTPPVLSEGEELVGVAHAELSEPRFLISTPTRQKNAAAALDARGFVLDHYNREAITQHLHLVAGPLLAALADNPPYAIFSDSLEVARADWTPALLDEFRRRRGYDLTPYLAALFEDIGENTSYVRHDWGLTLTELVEDNYLTPIQEWAAQHGTRFRSQTYGTPPVTLSSNARVDLPEGELGFYWRQFSPARWAASANHLYGRTVTSTETWTWLHSPVFRATPLDLKAEADLHFIQGVNQLIGHGWPYSAPGAGRPGWSFYAAGNFSDHNPWWGVMPSLALYLQRTSHLLRQGKPANDIAVYVPTADVYAGFTAANDEPWDHVSINRALDRKMGRELVPRILDAGYNFDYIDDGAIAAVGIPYPILILPNVERLSLATYERIAAYQRKGGIVIATQRLPALAPGLLEAKTDGPKIAALSRTLFTEEGPAKLVTDLTRLDTVLKSALTPDLATARGIGFIHRKLPFADVYFVVNTDNRPMRTPAVFRSRRAVASAWNPLDDTVTPLTGPSIELNLAPYESRVFVFSDEPLPGARPAVAGVSPPLSIDLSRDWKVTLGQSPVVTWEQLRSWTDDPATRHFSGEATYEKNITLTGAELNEGRRWRLNLGEGKPVDARVSFGMHALLESPVREAARVYVNDQLAGAVWCPPYEVDVTRQLRAGENKIRIVVGNLAINAIAGRPAADFKAVRDRYQSDIPDRYYNDDDLRRPLPSGLLGVIRLLAN